MESLWDKQLAKRTKRMESSIIREILKISQQPGVISFAGGMPSPDVFPIEAFNEACNIVLKERGAQALQYATTEGYLPLREMICRHTDRYGIKISTDNVLITTGSQQALDLIGKVFIDPGDKVIVEAPTYLGAIQSWNVYGAEYIQVPTDDDGMVLAKLEEGLKQNPKFIYLLPNFQNPSGRTIPLERRHKIIELAEDYMVPIVEDDPYGQLRFEGKNIPPVVVLDCEKREQTEDCYQGNIIYLSTFSKILAPGIRLAWVIAPPEILQRLVQAKQGSDLHTPIFTQMIAHEISKEGFLDRHINHIIEVYRRRRDVMLATMEKTFPPGVSWTHPEGGLFLWVTLPDGMNSREILEIAVDKKVAFVPGTAFYPGEGGENTMRLNFSFASSEEIKVGITRLGETLAELLEKSPA